MTRLADDLPPTLPGVLDRRAGERDVDALTYPDHRASFPEFAAVVRLFARSLHRAGVRRGDRVGILMSGSVDAYGLALGAMRAGAVPVPINVRFKARELAFVVGNAGMGILVADPGFAGLIEDAAVAERCRVVLGARDAGFATGPDAALDAELDQVLADLGPDDDALMLYTSGTTSNPKGCVHRHGALIAEGERFAERLSLTPDDSFWTPLPFFHVGGIAVLAGTLVVGCASAQMGYFDATQALDQLEGQRCTVAFPAFETIWLGVLNHPRYAEADLSALRIVVNAGVPSSLRNMQARMPGATQISCFGSTETCAFACLGNVNDPLEKRVTTSGVPLRDVEIRTIRPDGSRCDANEVGELLMRGPTRFVRYHEAPDLTAEVLDDEGFFHSGDLGRIDEDGRVSFVDRLKDMLKVGGENVAAAEVESYLLTHPSVEIVQVVGAPDARYVEVPTAFVQLRAGAAASEQELIEFCLGQISTFKVPRYVRFVEEWPMSGTKIQKFKLRERITAELQEAGVTEAPKLSSATRPAAR